MTSEEFINQQIAAGHKIHVNRGVWWQRVAPFCCKPVINFKETGTSNPLLIKSFLKYSYVVKDPAIANSHWDVMLLHRDKLKDFSIKSLSSSKRARVRKGLKFVEIKKIEDIEPVIDNIRDVCISTAIRTNHGLPPGYYLKKYKKWRSWLMKEFSLPNREWWGAYFNNSLIAYMYGVLIDDTMYDFTAKSHTDFLDKCPNDALIFTFLEYCKNLTGCNQVIFGDWSKNVPSLNKFKENFGFEKVELPMYVWINPLLNSLKKIKVIVTK